MIDITAILNVHSEGVMARVSQASIEAAAIAARTAGLRVELLAIADAADDVTIGAVSLPGWRVIKTNFRDLASARNAGVQDAQGTFLSFLDGDDLWDASWLIKAYHAAMIDSRQVIWHPEASLLFGANVTPEWFVHPELESDDGDWTRLGMRNIWTALSFASRVAYEAVPYRPNMVASGFGYEDWSWNAETIAQGWLHRPVYGTTHLVRIRPDSMSRQAARCGALSTPSTLFRSRVGWKVC